MNNTSAYQETHDCPYYSLLFLDRDDVHHMTTNAIMDELVKLADSFARHRDVSIYDLLKATAYWKTRGQISECGIREALLRHPECIQQWMAYSENKRTSSGWYVTRTIENKYLVGRLGKKPSRDNQIEFADPAEACAAFVKREIEWMVLQAR